MEIIPDFEHMRLYSKILIHVNMENIHSPFLYGAGICASVNIIAYLLQTIIISS